MPEGNGTKKYKGLIITSTITLLVATILPLVFGLPKLYIQTVAAQEVQQVQKAIDKKIDTLKVKLKTTDKEAKEHGTEIKVINEKLDNISKSIQDLKNDEIAQLRKEIAAIRQSVAKLVELMLNNK